MLVPGTVEADTSCLGTLTGSPAAPCHSLSWAEESLSWVGVYLVAAGDPLPFHGDHWTGRKMTRACGSHMSTGSTPPPDRHCRVRLVPTWQHRPDSASRAAGNLLFQQGVHPRSPPMEGTL